eukprot:11406391-Alexandrium_andersonii.AAC.1
MSASLVGSEMCIRDRCSTHNQQALPRTTSKPFLAQVEALKLSLNLCYICPSPPEGDTTRAKLLPDLNKAVVQ